MRMYKVGEMGPCIMRVRGPNNVGRAVRMDPSYGDHGKKKKCLLKSLTGCKLCATTPNRQHAIRCAKGRNV